MRTSALFGARNFGLIDIYGVYARQGGGGINFVRYGAAFFIDDPL